MVFPPRRTPAVVVILLLTYDVAITEMMFKRRAKWTLLWSFSLYSKVVVWRVIAFQQFTALLRAVVLAGRPITSRASDEHLSPADRERMK